MWLTTVTCTVSGDGGGEAETVTMDTSTPRTVASAAPRAAWAVTDQVSATVSENATASVHALPGERGGAGEGGGATTAMTEVASWLTTTVLDDGQLVLRPSWLAKAVRKGQELPDTVQLT